MAQYRLSLSIASRKDGRSATAMAAYRAGEIIHDQRTGQRFDFTHKRGILYDEIVLPSEAPDWASDRSELWNRSEAADKRQDAHIAREIQLSLPHELTDAQRREVTLQFARFVSDRYGIAVDTAVHRPNWAGDQRNHHAHLLLCTRPFDEESKTGFGNKIRALDAIAQGKQGKSNDVELLRETWAGQLNEALARAGVRTQDGVEITVDHRSYLRQGVDREPTMKEGPTATTMKRQGRASEKVTQNDLKRERDAIDRELAEASALQARLPKQWQGQEPVGRQAGNLNRDDALQELSLPPGNPTLKFKPLPGETIDQAQERAQEAQRVRIAQEEARRRMEEGRRQQGPPDDYPFSR